MNLTKMFYCVHCHVCPLKDVCEVGDADVSYHYHHDQNRAEYWDRMHLFTLNCL